MNLSLLFNICLLLYLGSVALWDYKRLIIPNQLLILGSIVGLILLLLNKNHSLVNAIIASCIMGGLAFGVSRMTRGGLGMGDVKLLSSLGLYMGVWSLLNMTFIATALSGIVGLVLLVSGKANKKTLLPFAPFLFISAMLMFVRGSL
ncbi:prepilin peptidase [Alkaliphilus transvaalensis]|uniref:prepilin peptidase n=1 Tax=Alkaliphilus transvaalensis TaxID=114628 RepID=UPI00047965BF|nr:A24 family peptidase [Alkaliphilus transvaalensis]